MPCHCIELLRRNNRRDLARITFLWVGELYENVMPFESWAGRQNAPLVISDLLAREKTATISTHLRVMLAMAGRRPLPLASLRTTAVENSESGR